jgi:glycerate-2-kinase
MSHPELLKQLDSLYRAGLDIEKLNARRSRLCQLKAGGAARWLSRLSPRVRTQVYVLSDVAPFGPQVVGSGPFWDGKVPHRVLADNSTWMNAITSQARKSGMPILHSSSGHLGSWQSWVHSAIQELQPTLRENRSGVFIFGGEPSVRLPARNASSRVSPKGGRQSHIALSLLQKLYPWILQGRIEVLAMSSDGSDGNSGAAGVYMDSVRFRKALAKVSEKQIATALRTYQSARFFDRLGGLVQAESRSPQSNVQDALIIRVL